MSWDKVVKYILARWGLAKVFTLFENRLKSQARNIAVSILEQLFSRMEQGMEKIITDLLMELLKGLVTPELIQSAKKMFVDWMREQVADTSNKIDDAVVEIIADALGVD
jgi:hypothetical protein